MPTTAVKTKRDERLWTKAKQLAQSEGHADDYAYIMGIYKRMTGMDKSILVTLFGRIAGRFTKSQMTLFDGSAQPVSSRPGRQI